MAIPKVFSSLDSGAPAISAAVMDSPIAVLRACLVTGYGSTPSAGWTEEFTGTNKAVFRNVAGSGATGAFFRVECLAGARGPFSIVAYSTMSDVDTGTDPTFTAYGWRYPSNSTNSQEWVLCATNTAFWLASADGTMSMFVGAGDVISNSVGDAYRYFTAGVRNTGNWPNPPSFLVSSNFGGSDAGVPGGWGGSLTTPNGLNIGRTHTGLGTAIAAGVLRPFTNTGRGVGMAGFPARPSENSASAACMEAHVLHGTGATAVIRGRLPGVYLPLFDTTAEAALATDLATAGAGSSTRLMKFRTSTTPAGLLLETTRDWGD